VNGNRIRNHLRLIYQRRLKRDKQEEMNMSTITVPDICKDHIGFSDQTRKSNENEGPHIIIVDDFYDDPELIREIALQQEYVQYSPPLAKHVGNKIASESRYDNLRGKCLSTALYTFRGIPVTDPVLGFRHNPESVKKQIEKVIDKEIDESSWEKGNDWWNGAFHLREQGNSEVGSIHHHYYENSIPNYGWSGIVYLSHSAPPNAGTSFWKNGDTNKYVGEKGEEYRHDQNNFRKSYSAENVFNRLVLFRENVYHKVEGSFGQNDEARLTQTFFFSTVVN